MTGSASNVEIIPVDVKTLRFAFSFRLPKKSSLDHITFSLKNQANSVKTILLSHDSLTKAERAVLKVDLTEVLPFCPLIISFGGVFHVLLLACKCRT